MDGIEKRFADLEESISNLAEATRALSSANRDLSGMCRQLSADTYALVTLITPILGELERDPQASRRLSLAISDLLERQSVIRLYSAIPNADNDSVRLQCLKHLPRRLRQSVEQLLRDPGGAAPL